MWGRPTGPPAAPRSWLSVSRVPIIPVMVNSAGDLMARKAQADLILERTAMQMGELLREAAGLLRPFPPFPGAFFTNAIEVDAAAAETPERGCVVVCGDGELYELKMSISFEEGVTDPVSARDETLTKLEDLHPRDYVAVAYEALSRVTEHLMERSGQGGRGSA